MPIDPHAADAAISRAHVAVEWMARARTAQSEPNRGAAADAHYEHARHLLLEAAALIDTRPRSLLAAPRARAQS